MPFNTVTINEKLVWECSLYQDLTRERINNLATYGQPFSPGDINYKTDLINDFAPDFAHVTVHMSHFEVMNNGYGQLIKPENFPLVKDFLLGKIKLPIGTYMFKDFVGFKDVNGNAYKRTIFTDLYKVPISMLIPVIGTYNYYFDDSPKVVNGKLSTADATYVHGSVGFALIKETTKFIVEKDKYKVIASIGALNDNWNLESSSGIAKVANALIPYSGFGPEKNNLKSSQKDMDEGKAARIDIIYTGDGKRMVASRVRVEPEETPEE